MADDSATVKVLRWKKKPQQPELADHELRLMAFSDGVYALLHVVKGKKRKPLEAHCQSQMTVEMIEKALVKQDGWKDIFLMDRTADLGTFIAVRVIVTAWGILGWYCDHQDGDPQGDLLRCFPPGTSEEAIVAYFVGDWVKGLT